MVNLTNRGVVKVKGGGESLYQSWRKNCLIYFVRNGHGR
jgi:hypothetical protein